MPLDIDNIDLQKFLVVGDRLLIKPRSFNDRTKGGLLLPASVQEKETIQSGYVIKAGPGYPIPAMGDEDDLWRGKSETVRYVPLQAHEGDLAVYLQNGSYEIEFNQEKYVIVPQSAVLLLIRDESLFA